MTSRSKAEISFCSCEFPFPGSKGKIHFESCDVGGQLCSNCGNLRWILTDEKADQFEAKVSNVALMSTSRVAIR